MFVFVSIFLETYDLVRLRSRKLESFLEMYPKIVSLNTKVTVLFRKLLIKIILPYLNFYKSLFKCMTPVAG